MQERCPVVRLSSGPGRKMSAFRTPDMSRPSQHSDDHLFGKHLLPLQHTHSNDDTTPATNLDVCPTLLVSKLLIKITHWPVVGQHLALWGG